MNKEQAKKALQQGKKITHDLLEPNRHRFITLKDGVITWDDILSDDGLKQDETSFWQLRKGQQWNEGWRIYSENKIIIIANPLRVNNWIHKRLLNNPKK